MVLPTRIGRLAIIAAGVPLAATMTTLLLASPWRRCHQPGRRWCDQRQPVITTTPW